MRTSRASPANSMCNMDIQAGHCAAAGSSASATNIIMFTVVLSRCHHEGATIMNLKNHDSGSSMASCGQETSGTACLTDLLLCLLHFRNFYLFLAI